MPALPLDGNWVDIGTILVAALYALLRGMISCSKMSIEGVVSDVSYGVSIFPMLLLSTAAFSSAPITALMSGNRVIISLAGLFSLIVLVKRTFDRGQVRF
jgi:hypothetical protein